MKQNPYADKVRDKLYIKEINSYANITHFHKKRKRKRKVLPHTRRVSQVISTG